MLNACQALKNVWHVAMDPLGRINARLAYSAAEGLITSPPTYPQTKTPFEMKNGPKANLEPNKRRKMAYDVSQLDARWQMTDASSDAVENQLSVPFDLVAQLPEVDESWKNEGFQQYIASLREWQWTSLGQRQLAFPKEDFGMEFTLMSYNTLSQELLEGNRYLYKHCKKSVLSWPYRKSNLIAEIKEADADIVCLQEVQDDHYVELYHPEMKALGYDGLYKKRTGDKKDGCAIFFRTELFALDSHISIEYYQPGIPVLNRDNIGLIATLIPHKDLNTKLCVATTHLLFNPRRGDIKLAQLQVLLAELDKAAFKGLSSGKVLYHPSILCGDMNSEPYSPLYNFLTRGVLHYYGIQSGDISGQSQGRERGNPISRNDILLPELGITTDCQYSAEVECRTEALPEKTPSPIPILEHGFRFESAYSHTHHNGCIEITTQHMKANCTVDYILFSAQHLKNNRLSLLGTRRLLSDKEVSTVGGLPNEVLSSDHLALVAKFLLKNV